MALDSSVSDSDVSAKFLVPVPILTAIALVLVILRIRTRVKRTRQMYVDDWFVLTAMVLSLVNFIFASVSFGYGWGHPISKIAPHDLTISRKAQFGYVTVWMATLCFVRLSIAASLFRFGQDKLWRGTLYGIMTLQVLISTTYIIQQFIQCRPVAAFWENVPGVKCWPTKPMVIYGWIIAGIYVAMDLTLALMPIRLLFHINRTRTERVLIGCLMATGLLATGILCAKMTTYPKFGKGDPMQDSVLPCVYTKVEELAGIIASCLPSLKAPAEKILRKAGILVSSFHNTRPSFVRHSPVELHEGSEGNASDQHAHSPQLGKEDTSIDSYSVKAKSSHTTLGGHKEGHDAV